MNKADLIKSVAARTESTEILSRQMVTAVLKTMEEELSRGNAIVLQGFGTLRPWPQNPRLGRNPRTGEVCPIAPRISAKFKAGKDLLDAMNKR